MILILKEDKLDINRIKIKKNKNCIKFTYNIDNIQIIGLPFQIKEYVKKEIYNNILLIELLNKKQIEILNKIDNFISSKIDNYISFIVDNKYIKIKDHLRITNTNGVINITINSLKRINDQYYRTQIYTI